MELKHCHLRHGALASKQLVMPRRQKVMNHHLEMVMMMMEMMKTQEKERVPSPTKRGAEARGSTEPSPTRIRVEEPPAVVEERPEKLPKVSKVRLPEPDLRILKLKI